MAHPDIGRYYNWRRDLGRPPGRSGNHYPLGLDFIWCGAVDGSVVVAHGDPALECGYFDNGRRAGIYPHDAESLARSVFREPDHVRVNGHSKYIWHHCNGIVECDDVGVSDRHACSHHGDRAFNFFSTKKCAGLVRHN